MLRRRRGGTNCSKISLSPKAGIGMGNGEWGVEWGGLLCVMIFLCLSRLYRNELDMIP